MVATTLPYDRKLPVSRAAESANASPAAGSETPGSAAETAWTEAKRRLARSLPESTYRMWLAPVKATAIRGDRLYLDAPDPIRTWVQRRYTDLIEGALEQGSEALSSISFERATPQAPSAGGVPSTTMPNPTHLFDRFVIGPGNHLAHAAALAVAEAPSEAYNPLFLHGDPGLGKTHLLGAIANYLEQNVPELNVLYASAESFTAEFVTALREDGTSEFKRRYRDLDVLLIDDIQFIASKAATEQEFFHTFNALYESGSQIVLSADRMPTEISTLADRLSDRFEWGLTVPLEQPNLATRLTVLRRLVTEAGLEVSDQEALTLLAKRVQTNLRQLHGALTRSIAEASLRSTPLDSELVHRVFPSQATPDGPVNPELIRKETAGFFQTSAETLQSRRRDANTTRARHVAIFLTREMTTLSLPQIGALYGDRDHTTVLNSIRRVDQQLLTDPEVTRAVESLRAAIHSDRGSAR